MNGHFLSVFGFVWMAGANLWSDELLGLRGLLDFF
jgi:hypothetical protein